MLPKLIFTDIDGVWTDGGMYYDQTGNEWKKFNTTDSMGVLLCNATNIEIAMITGEKTKIVERRAKKLNIKYVIQGSQNKLKDAEKLCSKLHIKLKDTAYIGDDLIDLPLLAKAAFSAAPANAPAYIKEKVNYVTKKTGGNGAFREFTEEILRRENKLEKALAKILDNRYKG